MSQKFYELVPSRTNFDFVGKFKLFFLFSSVCVITSISLMFTKGFNFGIDFTGGSVLHIAFHSPISISGARAKIESANIEDFTIAALGSEQKEYLVTLRPEQEQKDSSNALTLIQSNLKSELTVLQADAVGPKVGSELKSSAIRSLVYSILLIMIYIWFRFDFKFAPGATIAMIHDIIVAAGFYIVTGKEFNITAVAALLTIAGYSVNDTIVIYDRVRELLGKDTPDSLKSTINRALNLTLSRTLLTSGVTFLSIIPIAVFCTGEIKDFAESILVGIFVGSYSTIYVAAPLTIYIEHFFENKSQAKLKRA